MTDPDADWFLGIDAGLTNVKSALFDAAGQEHAVAIRRPETVEPAPDWVERDPAALWGTVRETIAEVIDAATIAPLDIDGIGVAGHGHGLYALDSNGDPVRNAILSTDGRAADQVERWEADGRAETMRDLVGYGPFGADPLSLLAWLRRHEPDAYDRIDTLCSCKDYLKYRLTGAVCTDPMEASVFFDPERAAYSTAVFEALDLGAVADALPDIVPSSAVAGHVTGSTAAETGLDSGTPVASGLHDIGATALGSGIHRANQAMLIVGTWGQSIVVLGEPPDDIAGLTRRYLDDGWLRYAGNRSAATCLDWFVDQFGTDWRGTAAERDVDPYAIYNEVAGSVEPGADGLLFHPYLHGSTDRPAAMAGFYGLRPDHTAAHFLRAIYEGVALAQVEALERLIPGDRLDAVRLGGGGARSDVWCQVFADALDHELAVAAGDEAGARGAAICAALATDRYPDHAEAVDAMVEVDRRHRPQPTAAATYDRLRPIFVEAVEAMAPVWKRLNDVAEDGA